MIKSKSLFLSLLLIMAGLALATAGPVRADDRGKSEAHIRVCPKSGVKEAADCHARVVVETNGQPKVTTIPSGYGPKQFLGAYNLSPNTTTNTTIAIVDAYDHPNIFNDLNTYSATFGIPQMNQCAVSSGTTSRPCFQKVDQNGGTRYPSTNAGWALEIALDVETAHAICQNCNILLVEANSNQYTDLMAAVDRAAMMGAKVISNSYGSNEFSTEASFDSHFNLPGRAITFSSGDAGYGVEYPAASPYVTAVGGTTLNVDTNNNWLSETAWNGAGSGCSAYEFQPSWQTSLGLTGCTNRTVADVSADADPNTGAAVYDSVRYQGRRGWFKVGGTSLAAPLVAGVYALAGIPSATQANSLPYSNKPALHDIISGSNGSCGGLYLCTAMTGYDGPTGLGSPLGMAAF